MEQSEIPRFSLEAAHPGNWTLHILLVGKGGYYATTMDGLTLLEKLKSILFFGVLDPDVSLHDSARVRR